MANTKFSFSWGVTTRGASGGPYQRMLRNIEKLRDKEKDELDKAARKATAASRRTFRTARSGRPFVAPRAGRRTTQGRFESHIVWLDGIGQVDLAEDELRDEAPYYLINEIGTGNTGTRFRHMGAGADGHPKITPTSFAMPSQKGRYIKPGLVWADGGNAVSPASSRFRQDQIRPAAQVSTQQVSSERRRRKRAAVNPLRTPRVRISRDIEPKHYIREGATTGYNQYSAAVRSAARGTFERR